jgi:PKD repeat protein
MSPIRAARRIAVFTLLGAALLASVAVAEPQTDFVVSPDPPTAGEPVTFTAEDPCVEPVTCTWNFGDGTVEESGESVAHVYAESGVVTASLTVDDVTDTDEPVTTSKPLVVLPPPPPNRAPEAAIAASPTSPATGEVVQFDSAASSDPDGDQLRREWDLDGDGAFETGDEVQPFRSYSADGPVTVSLQVTDPDGKSDVATVAINVVNRPPTASITASTTTPLSGAPVDFQAVAQDADGSIASYAWDLDGDGDYDDGTGPSASTTFALPGRAVIRLRVTDDDGASVTVEHEVIVQVRPATGTPEPQVVPASAVPAPVSAPVPVTLPVTVRAVLPPRLMTPFPVVRFAGALRPGGARLTLFTVTAPKGARIVASCRGKGCPRARSIRAAGVMRLAALQRVYRAGSRIEVRVTRRKRIGKYVRITIRKGKPPARRDACLWPGARRPRACP